MPCSLASPLALPSTGPMSVFRYLPFPSMPFSRFPQQPREIQFPRNGKSGCWYNSSMSDQLDSIQSVVTCPYCDGSNFATGYVHSSLPLYFRKDDIKLFGRGEAVQARKCLTCGNLQLFIAEN